MCVRERERETERERERERDDGDETMDQRYTLHIFWGLQANCIFLY